MSEIVRIRKSVKAVLKTRDNFVLLLRRAAGDTRPGSFDLPGGGVDEGETMRAAMLREAYEETGLVLPANDFELFHVNDMPCTTDSDITNRRGFYIGHITGNEAFRLGPEQAGLQLVRMHEAIIMVEHPALQDALLVERFRAS